MLRCAKAVPWYRLFHSDRFLRTAAPPGKVYGRATIARMPAARATDATATPPELRRKLCAREHLQAALARLPRPLVFTNGVFDILHRGHVT